MQIALFWLRINLYEIIQWKYNADYIIKHMFGFYTI